MENDAFLADLTYLIFECSVSFEINKKIYYNGNQVSEKQYFLMLEYLDRVKIDDRQRNCYLLNIYRDMLEAQASEILNELIEQFEWQTPLPNKQFELRCKII